MKQWWDIRDTEQRFIKCAKECFRYRANRPEFRLGQITNGKI